VSTPGHVQENGDAAGGPPDRLSASRREDDVEELPQAFADMCAPPRAFEGMVSHPEVSREVPSLDLPQLKFFSLREMLMHAMLSCRVASEGVGKAGSGCVKDLYTEIMRLSKSDPELTIPSTGSSRTS